MRSHEYYKILKITKPTFEVKNKVVFTKTIKSLVRERERQIDTDRRMMVNTHITWAQIKLG